MKINRVKGFITFFVIFQIFSFLMLLYLTEVYLGLFLPDNFLSILPQVLTVRTDTFYVLSLIIFILQISLTFIMVYITYESIKQKVNSFRIFFINLFLFFNLLIYVQITYLISKSLINNANVFNADINLASSSILYLLIAGTVLVLVTLILSISYLNKIRDKKKLEAESKLDRFIMGFFQRHYFIFNIVFVSLIALGILVHVIIVILYIRDRNLESFNILQFMSYKAYSPALIWLLTIGIINYFFEVHHRLSNMTSLNETMDFLLFNYALVLMSLSNIYYILRYTEDTLSQYDFYINTLILVFIGIVGVSSVLRRDLDLADKEVEVKEEIDEED